MYASYYPTDGAKDHSALGNTDPESDFRKHHALRSVLRLRHESSLIQTPDLFMMEEKT